MKSQGWTALILDTNGNGKRDAYVEPNQPLDPTKDQRIGGALYAVAPAPDGSIWGTQLGYPGRGHPAVARREPARDGARRDLSSRPSTRASRRAASTSIATASYWAALASGHLASFDRRKCKGPLNGPTATGQHCPEGWTFYTEPVPQFKGVTDSGSAEASYYTWVDQFDTLGLGRERADQHRQRGRRRCWR